MNKNDSNPCLIYVDQYGTRTTLSPYFSGFPPVSVTPPMPHTYPA